MAELCANKTSETMKVIIQIKRCVSNSYRGYEYASWPTDGLKGLRVIICIGKVHLDNNSHKAAFMQIIDRYFNNVALFSVQLRYITRPT